MFFNKKRRNKRFLSKFVKYKVEFKVRMVQIYVMGLIMSDMTFDNGIKHIYNRICRGVHVHRSLREAIGDHMFPLRKISMH